ncbi:MAG TPA: amino acid permease [Steroidobacteraceae bacterium]|nr:amino acid permease [Steroidobacteraceae bacterium]
MTRAGGLAILRRKSVALCVAESRGERGPHLERALGFWSLTAFGVGCTIGAGIFSLTGEVAAHQAGPAVSLAFVLASVACFLAGLCYAEFAAMVPISGSAYSYAYVTLGELTAWIIGWCLVIEWLFSASLVAISWSGYAQAALREFGVLLPPPLAQAPFTLDAHHHLMATGAWLDLPAVAVVLGCTALLLAGMRTSAAVNTAIVLAKVLALIVLVVVGARYVHPGNWRPFIPENTGSFGQFGWSGLARGAGILFFAYLGFDGVSTLAEEARNPQRTLPWSLFASLLICAALYVGVSLVITGLADYRSLAVADPLYHALSAAQVPLGPVKALVSVVALVGLVSVVLACIVGQVRIFYAMARDGLLPPALARVSGAHRTLVSGTLVTGGVAALIAGVIPLGALAELISLGTLLAFAMVCVGVLVLRRIEPGAERPFRTPWVPLVPALGIVSCVALMVSLPGATWLQLCAWSALGLLIYVAYGRRHSRLRAAPSAAGGSGERA